MNGMEGTYVRRFIWQAQNLRRSSGAGGRSCSHSSHCYFPRKQNKTPQNVSPAEYASHATLHAHQTSSLDRYTPVDVSFKAAPIFIQALSTLSLFVFTTGHGEVQTRVIVFLFWSRLWLCNDGLRIALPLRPWDMALTYSLKLNIRVEKGNINC